MESKYFIPSDFIDCFKNPIPTLDAFKEGNMANITPTISVNISSKLSITKNIIPTATYFPKEVTSYTKLF